MKKLSLHKLISALALFVLLSLTQTGVTYAANSGVCSLASGEQRFNVGLGHVAVERNLPVGTLLLSKDFSSGQLLASCTDGGYQAQVTLLPAYAAGSAERISGDNVYPTSIQGIGIAVRVDDNPVDTNTILSKRDSSALSPKVTLRLYKTGIIKSGSLQLGNILSYKLADSSGLTNAATYTLTSGEVSEPACEIKGTSAIPVAMGTVLTSDFHGKGSMLNPKKIDIPLSCNEGTKVNITFAATSSLGDGIIDLTAGGAKGIGIKLMYNQVGIEFNKSTFIAKAQQNGDFNIPLKAAFIQTSNSVSSGEASAVANFTITYD